MLKMMIVDDEPLVRVGLESLLNWAEIGYTLVPCATNGEEGLAHIIKYKPDVVITDIKMPVMDGVEMIEKCKEKGLAVKFIVLSSYDDFQLVKQVMKMGAVDYLIKLHLNENELRELLLKLKRELGESEKENTKTEKLKVYLENNKNTLKQEFIRKMMFGIIDLENREMLLKTAEELGIEEEMHYGLCCLKLIEGEHEIHTKISEMTSFYLVNMCQDVLADFGDSHVFVRSEREFIIFLSFAKEDKKEDEYSALMIKVCERMHYMIKQYFSKMVVIGISNQHHHITQLNEALKETTKAIQLIATNKKLPIYFYSDKEKYQAKSQGKVDILDLKDSLITAMDTGDEALLNHLFEEIGKRFENCVSRQNAYEICYKLVYIVSVLGPNGKLMIQEIFDKDYTEFENIQAFTTIDEVAEWIEALHKGLNKFISHKYLDIANFKVNKVKQYIGQNVYTKITLPEVAEKMEISAGYLSTIFKKVEGKSFSDYVAEVKMNEAKKLLKEHQYKVYEVSSKLGYDDPYYFSKLFKKVTAMTPTEFMCKV
ncbi:MAG: response regulator [Clostridia bacterium]|jgi:YesN/AraC family two-component response regulator|nr:response regulator [Clostridia bacterium]